MQNLITVIIGIVLGIASAYFAKRRGRNVYAWFFIGLFLGIFGLLLLFVLPEKKTETATSPANPAASTASLSDASASPKIDPKNLEWYYLDLEKHQYGPMSLEQLQTAFAEGKLNDLSYVW